jgi:hypothetical protein
MQQRDRAHGTRASPVVLSAPGVAVWAVAQKGEEMRVRPGVAAAMAAVPTITRCSSALTSARSGL